MPKRRRAAPPGERPETAPAVPPLLRLPYRLKTLRGLAHEFLQEADTVLGSCSLEAEESVDFLEEMRRCEIELICWALRRTGGHQRRAAQMLNLKVSTLNAKIRRYRIQPHAFSLSPFQNSTTR